MNPARLDNLWQTGVAFDLETHLLQPGLPTPPVVCGSIAMLTPNGFEGELLSKDQARDAFVQILAEDWRTLIGAKISYDVSCMLVDFARRGIDLAPQIFRMYDPTQGAALGQVDGRVIDVQMFEQLHAISRGVLGLDPMTMRKITDPETGKQARYSLATVVRQVLGRDNAKANDRYRMSYALLEHVPIAQWPAEARTYPVDDAVNTLEVGLAQAGLVRNVGPHAWVEGSPPSCAACGALPGGAPECRSRYRRSNSHDLSRQVYAAICLDLGAAWGFKVDQNAVDELERKYDAEHDDQKQPFIDAGILRADGTCNEAVLKGLVARAYGARAACPTCERTTDKRGTPKPGKMPSDATQGRTLVNCKACDGSGLELPPACPRAEKGGIGKGRDALGESGDEFLMSYADHGEGKKIKTVYIPYLRNTDRDDVTHPHVPRTLRPNAIVETGRVSYDGATMLLPRSGGVRECIVARPGRVLSSEDYKAGELVTHAQSCIWITGASRLAEYLNTGEDAHTALAGTVLGIPYAEITRMIKEGDKRAKNGRQISKPPNFGFPGRMGPFKLAQQQRKQNDVHTPHPSGPAWLDDGKGGKVRGYKGLRFCLLMNRADRCGEVMINEWKGRTYDTRMCKKCVETSDDLKKSWSTQWPENAAYFAHVKQVDDAGAPIVQHMSKRLRGFRQGMVDDDGQPINSGNAIANGYFQALLADAAKNALMVATRECYDRTVRVRSHTKYTSAYEGLDSPLYGSRIPQFQHDELIGDHPADMAHDGATRISEIMCETLRIACPDLAPAVDAEPCLMLRLYKGAQTTRDASGRLIPWEPKIKAAA